MPTCRKQPSKRWGKDDTADDLSVLIASAEDIVAELSDFETADDCLARMLKTLKTQVVRWQRAGDALKG
jgi:hypothetical protein